MSLTMRGKPRHWQSTGLTINTPSSGARYVHGGSQVDDDEFAAIMREAFEVYRRKARPPSQEAMRKTIDDLTPPTPEPPTVKVGPYR
jgi:hypothetical protein